MLPRSLAGRVFLIIIAGLVVAHLASYALFEIERTRSIENYSATEIAARIVEAVRNPPAPQPAGPPAAGPREPGGGPGRMRNRIRWRETETLQPAPADATPPSSGFDAELRRLLVESLGADPIAWMSVLHRVGGNPPPPGPRPFTLLSIGLKLPGERFAVAETPFMQPTRGIPAEAWTSIALVFFVTALFSIWAIRLAVNPLWMLANAADRLSRNIDEPPLPEKGASEIRSATRAFNRMQDRLKRHVNSRALAFAAMSHDIRTPLTRMRLRLESLGPEAKERLGENLDEIEAIAKSVLELTRGLSAEEAVVEVDLGAMVRRLADDFEPMGEKFAVRGTGAKLRARPAALRRALTNLVENALKYGREVEIELGETKTTATIAVADRGPGIPDADLQKVVIPFYRVESSRNRDTGGAGLGLAIAKDIVEGHGGELLLENREGGGLVATIRLPR